jgi:hypothetical protein
MKLSRGAIRDGLGYLEAQRASGSEQARCDLLERCS